MKIDKQTVLYGIVWFSVLTDFSDLLVLFGDVQDQMWAYLSK